MAFPLMKIYLAARYSKAELLAAIEEKLAGMGYTITSRWMHGRPDRSDAELLAAIAGGEVAARIFVHDRRRAALTELAAADLFLEFTDEGSSSGGRHFEAGYAAALGLERWIVGPVENVFQTDPEVVHVPDWTAAERALRDVSTALTVGQLEVWIRVLQGKSAKAIGLELDLSTRAVYRRLDRARWNWPDLPKRNPRRPKAASS